MVSPVAATSAAVPRFVANPTSGYAPLTVQFTDQSLNSPTSWRWDYSKDGAGYVLGFSTAQNPSYTFSQTGVYTIRLKAENAKGGDYLVKTNYITVTAPPPVAAFTATPTSGSSPLTVTFTDQSTNSPTSWSWTFGDGQTSTSQNPSHAYATPGTYTVTLTATNAVGSDGETKTNYITVTAPTTPPVAAFTATPTSGAASLTVAFTDQSTNSPTSWSWNFGDGQTSTAQNPSHTYATSGTYTVTLTATNAAGSDGEIKTGYITVTVPPPVAAFTATPTSGIVPLAVAFTDQSTNTPTSWSWNFGDGQTATAQNPSHTYSTPGTYTVSLTATNAGGSDPEVKNSYITVINPPPGAAFTGTPTSGVAPQSVAFTDQSTNTPTSWSWNFGDGQSSTSQNPSHSYTTPGTFTVSLTATNVAGGNTLTRTDYITITPPPPHATFTMTPASGATPLVVTFTDQSTGFPATWSWDFGDGHTSTAQNPSHTYDTPGTFTVTLTVTNVAGSDDETKTDSITVTVPLPVAAFSGTPVSGPVPLIVTFTDQSTNTPTSWSWDFGDGNTATFQSPSHTYIAQGSYTVTLTATNAGGSDSEIKIGYVTVGNPTQSLVFITSTDTDRKTAKKGDMVNVSIRLIAGEATPVDGMFLLDRSGDSMGTCMSSVNGNCQYTRWDLAKEGALLLTGNMSKDTKMGVSWFATRGDIAHSMDNSPTQVAGEIQALDYVPYGYTPEPYTGPGTGGIAGMSNLRDGLYKTIKYLGPVQNGKLRTKALVVFTDGLYNWYGSPLAAGRGYALRTREAQIQCDSGICHTGNHVPYNPANVNTYFDDKMWWENSAMEESAYDRPTCWFPTYDYTFYNWIRENRPNGGWMNFTGFYWNGMAALGDGAHITYPTYTSAPSYTARWHLRYGETQCMFPGGWGHCDEITESQYQLDVSDPYNWPYIEYINGVKTLRYGSEQTEQNMTIFARDYNIRLYMVDIHAYAETGNTMPSNIVTTDDVMKTLAYTTGGKYYAVRDRDDLYAAIDDITRDLSSSATKDLTMKIEDTSVDVNSLLRVNTNNQVFAHHHLADISTTTQSWDMNGNPIRGFTTIPEAQDWLATHHLNYFVDDLSVGDTFQMNYTVEVNARGRINAIGPDSVVTFKDGYELPLPPTYIDVENSPPVFDDLGQQTVDLMDPLTFLISATDADNDPLTYASISLPAGATFDPDTLQFEWTPGEKGIYSATFSVTDGMATVTQTVPIIVTDLQAKIVIR